MNEHSKHVNVVINDDDELLCMCENDIFELSFMNAKNDDQCVMHVRFSNVRNIAQFKKYLCNVIYKNHGV